MCSSRPVVKGDELTEFGYQFFFSTATRIINEVRGINRVVYDITSKPPGTIEWEEGAIVKPVTIYGIPNCDTMKKARAWLDGHGVAYDFHDYKKAGIDRAAAREVEPEGRLGDAAQPCRHDLPQASRRRQAGLDERKAIDLMLAQPSLIKRPVLELGGGKLLVGFKPEIYEEAFDR